MRNYKVEREEEKTEERKKKKKEGGKTEKGRKGSPAYSRGS